MTAPKSAGWFVWKLHQANPGTASVRYRCLLPVLADARLRERSVIIDGERRWRGSSAVGALILVKTFRKLDVALCRQAHAEGIPVYFDLCDNIYADGYGGREGSALRRHFEQIAALCEAVTTTGQSLRSAIHAASGLPFGKIVIQSDPFETRELTEVAVESMRWPNRGEKQRLTRAARPFRDFAKSARDLLRRAYRSEIPIDTTTPPLPASSGRPRALWFGGSGNPHSGQGLAALADSLPVLSQAFSRHPFDLHVVSDDANAYQQLIANRGIPSSFQQWSPMGIFSALDSSDFSLLPIGGDRFSQSKSANRLLLSMAHGVPVVAGDLPAYRPFADCVLLGNLGENLLRYLGDAELIRRHLAVFRDRHYEQHTPASAGSQWFDRLTQQVDEQQRRNNTFTRTDSQ